MPNSPYKLASCLENDEKTIKKNLCKSNDEFNLLNRTGVFAYDCTDSWQKLEEDQLALKETFYSKLNDQGISEENDQHAYKVWEAFEFKTLGQYSDLYIKTDTLLLKDIFKNIRKKLLRNI